MKSKKKSCQYCGTIRSIVSYVPSGDMCKTCRNNLLKIRKFKLGIPAPRITYEMNTRYNLEMKEYGKETRKD